MAWPLMVIHAKIIIMLSCYLPGLPGLTIFGPRLPATPNLPYGFSPPTGLAMGAHNGQLALGAPPTAQPPGPSASLGLGPVAPVPPGAPPMAQPPRPLLDLGAAAQAHADASLTAPLHDTQSEHAESQDAHLAQQSDALMKHVQHAAAQPAGPCRTKKGRAAAAKKEAAADAAKQKVALSKHTSHTQLPMQQSKRCLIAYPGVPKKPIDAISFGAYQIYTDVTKQRWRVKRLGERKDKAFGWVSEPEVQWKRLRA